MLAVLIISLGALYLAVDPFAFRAYRAEELALHGEARRAARAHCDRSSPHPSIRCRSASPRVRSCRSSTSMPARPIRPGRRDLWREMRGLPRRWRPGTHGPVRDAGRAGHLSPPRRPAGSLSLPPTLELRPWLAQQRRDAAHGGWADRGRLGRHRLASGASHRGRLPAAARLGQRPRGAGPFHRHARATRSRREPVRPLPWAGRHRRRAVFSRR